MVSSSKEFNESSPDLDFTGRAFDEFYDVVDDPYFRDQDLYAIYEALKDKIQVIPFGDFLNATFIKKADDLTGKYVF